MEWNNIISEYEGSFFLSEAWLKVLEDIHGYRIFKLKEDRAIFPLALVKSRLFGNRLISLPFSDYGGPCGEVTEVEKLIGVLWNICRELNLDFIEVRCPRGELTNILIENGFKSRIDYCTFKLELSKGEKEIWRNLNKKTRNAVRKAKKSGVEVKKASNSMDLKDFYNLYLETMKKLGSPPQSYYFFERLSKLPTCKIRLAEYKGTRIAGMLFFIFEDIIYYYSSTSSLKYQNLRPNNLLLWSMIKEGCDSGLKVFDFGRTRKDSGVYSFKKGWGGEEVPMTYYYKFYKRELKERQEIRYRGISKLWSKLMPNFLAKKLGPWLIKQIG